MRRAGLAPLIKLMTKDFMEAEGDDDCYIKHDDTGNGNDSIHLPDFYHVIKVTTPRPPPAPAPGASRAFHLPVPDTPRVAVRMLAGD